MRRGVAVVAQALVAILVGLPGPALQAQVPDQDETIAVFLDCQTFGCDADFFRTEVNFVNWVRDREVADVHLLVTSEATGGGGRFYTLRFIGRDDFDGVESELTFASSGDATSDDVRVGLAEAVARGLVPFVADRPVAERLTIEYRSPAGEAAQGAAPGSDIDVDDPWDFWVFTVRANGFFNGESSITGTRVSGSVSARRTTEALKLSLSVSGSRNQTDFDLGDRTVESAVEDWTTSGLLAFSLNDHWTAGSRLRAGSSTRRNQDFFWRVSPGLEFNVFPYAESTRRELTFLYSLGVNHWNYEGETIFGETEETRLDHSVTAQLDLSQPWGSASIFSEAGHFFHDTSKWQVTVGGFMRIRLFKGFSLNVNGNYSWIRDQLYLPAAGASDDEILTRQRQLATDFRYFTSIGFSYTFGSIFNNVVNPRFGGGGGGEVVFF